MITRNDAIRYVGGRSIRDKNAGFTTGTTGKDRAISVGNHRSRLYHRDR